MSFWAPPAQTDYLEVTVEEEEEEEEGLAVTSWDLGGPIS